MTFDNKSPRAVQLFSAPEKILIETIRTEDDETVLKILNGFARFLKVDPSTACLQALRSAAENQTERTYGGGLQ